MQAHAAVSNEWIAINVSGCVYKPGKHSIPSGAALRAALRKARLKPLANLDGLDLDQRITESMDLVVPMRDTVIVEIKGAVQQNLSLSLPAGSRICDLKNRVELADDADIAFLRRRRILRHLEEVEIPRKPPSKRF